MTGSRAVRNVGIAFCAGYSFGAILTTVIDDSWTAHDITRCAELPQWCAEEMPRLHAALKEAGL